MFRELQYFYNEWMRHPKTVISFLGIIGTLFFCYKWIDCIKTGALIQSQYQSQRHMDDSTILSLTAEKAKVDAIIDVYNKFQTNKKLIIETK